MNKPVIVGVITAIISYIIFAILWSMAVGSVHTGTGNVTLFILIEGLPILLAIGLGVHAGLITKNYLKIKALGEGSVVKKSLWHLLFF